MRAAVFAFLLAGCGSDGSELVVGPFTGETHRYALADLRLPVSNTDARLYGGDLDGNGNVDNALGMLLSTLAGMGDGPQHVRDMIIAGAIPTALEVTADDLGDDPTVGVRYLGTPDSPAIELGGRIFENGFQSNPAASTAFLGESQLVLPALADADPVSVTAIAIEIRFWPDEVGGLWADVHAAIPHDESLMREVHRAFAQMVATNPTEHRYALGILDVNPKDGAISYDEFENNSLVVSLLGPDLVFDDRDVNSIGIRAYFQPCTTGQCLESEPYDHCYDRLLDADETDVDCGGSCRACQGGATCAGAADCLTMICEQGRCAAPSCTDGIRDGLESDVDCGYACPGCALGKHCFTSGDCASMKCGPAPANTCTQP